MTESTETVIPQASGSFTCPLCQKSYAARSSYVRHSKHCGKEQDTGPPRQKSCRQCSKSKTRCDQRHPTCSRCISRGDRCEYASRNYQENSQRAKQPSELQFEFENQEESIQVDEIPSRTNGSTPTLGHHLENPSVASATTYTPAQSPNDREPTTETVQSEGFRPVEPAAFTATVPISDNVEALRERWLYPFLEDSPAKIAIRQHSMEFLCRVLRTYPRMMARSENVPPIIHPMQVSAEDMALPLANCFALAKMWEGSAQPAGELVKQTIQREMERLFNEYRTYDAPTLVAAFQALLIYSIILLFPNPQKPSPGTFNQVTLIALQDLGCYVGETDLNLSPVTQHNRPSWETWVIVNAKRRTLMALYCFEWMYARLNALPTYPCTEIGFMPGPAGKSTWGARSRDEWECAYGRWLGRWAEGGFYTIKELANVRPGPEIDARTELWLEEADEFGMMMYMSLVNATEGHLSVGSERKE